MGNVGFEGGIRNMWMTILSTLGTKEQIRTPPIIGLGLHGNLRTIMMTSPLFDIVGIIPGTATTVFFKADRRGPFFLFTLTRVSDLVDKFQFVITTLHGEGGRISHHFTLHTVVVVIAIAIIVVWCDRIPRVTTETNKKKFFFKKTEDQIMCVC